MSQPLVFLRLPEVVERVMLKKSRIYKHMKAREFPEPAKLGGMSVWVEHEIDAWVAARLTARQGSQPSAASS